MSGPFSKSHCLLTQQMIRRITVKPIGVHFEISLSPGVDLVLNSLSDEKLQASLRVLAIHGRFLEIGKFDLSKNTPLGKDNLE